jgi:predicted nucleic acid-binding Zn ribbon protein
VDNHHHCTICGDLIDASERVCSKVACIQRYTSKEVRCQRRDNGYIFKPNGCVNTCKGYRMNGPVEGYPDSMDFAVCWQLGKRPPEPTIW